MVTDKPGWKPQPSNDAPDCESKACQSASKSRNVVGWRWLLGVMDRHNGALNAIFSAFVAFFTLMLFLVGRGQHNTLKASVIEAKRAGDAATSTAQAAINVELPTLVYATAILVRASAVGNDGRNRVNTVEQSIQFPRFEITIKNYGRTPAFVSGVGADTFVGSLPEKPTWIEYFDLDSSVVIEPKEPYAFETIQRKSLLGDAEVKAVMDGLPLWVCWFVIYRDFLGRRNIYRDARRLYVLNAHGAHVFIDEAPDAYKSSGHIIEQSHGS